MNGLNKGFLRKVIKMMCQTPDLSYLTRKWDEYFDVVPALCGRWNGGWNDFLKESLLNLTCM